MIELQALREAQPGIAFPPDSEWQAEFDAAFPYQETPDQLTTLAEIKRDMEAPRPMDRLICGDVGYGKTELAIRAASRRSTTASRWPSWCPPPCWPSSISAPSASAWRNTPLWSRASAGSAAPASRSASSSAWPRAASTSSSARTGWSVPTCSFKDLGLVIIDEEQRFGVEHKERLKRLRQTVDVLTMTATPIPRTLHLALLGIRDISNLETPPADRLAIETRIARFDPSLDPPRHPARAEPRGPGLLRPQPRPQHPRSGRPPASHCAGGALRHRPRPDGRTRAGTGHAPLRPAGERHPGGHHHHRERPGHSQREHHLHQPGRQLRAGRPAPAPRPGRAATSTGPTPTCCSTRTGRSRPRRPGVSRRSRSSPSWGPASRSPCATWKSAGPATSSGRSRAGTSRRSATRCTASSWRTPCAR